MPVSVRGSGFSVGEGKNYYSTDNVTDIKIGSASGKVNIQWTDPQDTTLDAIVFAAWAGTLVVRKEGSAPINEKDGTVVTDSKVRNQYKNVALVDTDVVVGKTYYYGIFPYTDQEVYNNSAENIAKVLVTTVNPVFSEATWDEVVLACQSRDVPETWNIGDEKDIQLTGTYAQVITMQIWGKNLDDCMDGTKAPLTFGMKNLMANNFKMDNDGFCASGYQSTDFRKSIIPQILQGFPEQIQNAMRNIKVLSSKGSSVYTTEEKLTIPSITNVGLGQISTDHQYPIFTDNSSRVKKASNGTRTAKYYLSRTFIDEETMEGIGEKGDRGNGSPKFRNDQYVCLMFCL